MIKVLTTDGQVIEVGGDFQRALAAVKQLSAPRFDGMTKTWTVGADAKQVIRHCATWHLPCEAPDGTYWTKYGNGYNRSERDAFREMAKAEAEAEREMQPAVDAVDAWLDEQLAAYYGSADDARIAPVGRIIRLGDFEEAVEDGKLRFHTPAREPALRAIDEEYGKRIEAAVDARESAVQAARERIEEMYGF